MANSKLIGLYANYDNSGNFTSRKKIMCASDAYKSDKDRTSGTWVLISQKQDREKLGRAFCEKEIPAFNQDVADDYMSKREYNCEDDIKCCLCEDIFDPYIHGGFLDNKGTNHKCSDCCHKLN